jgi:hypothetical protein
MVSYDTVIEPIFLQGNFCVNTDCEITEFLLPQKADNVQRSGFPFFNGIMTVEGAFCGNGNEEYVLRLVGNFATAEVYVNDVKQGTVALDEEIIVGKIPTGKNKIKILVKSTMRNMYGPHHCRGMQEDWPIARHVFTFFKEWQYGKPDYFIEGYNLAAFGIEKIQIEVKK